jgi:hypothetical protein
MSGGRAPISPEEVFTPSGFSSIYLPSATKFFGNFHKPIYTTFKIMDIAPSDRVLISKIADKCNCQFVEVVLEQPTNYVIDIDGGSKEIIGIRITITFLATTISTAIIILVPVIVFSLEIGIVNAILQTLSTNVNHLVP